MSLLRWVAATVAGCLVAGVVAHFPGSFPVGSGTQTELSVPAAAFGLAMGTLFGLPLGLLQWLVVRRSPGIGRPWILATALGVGVMHALGDGAPAPAGGGGLAAADGWLAIGAVGGLAVGALQALAGARVLVVWTWVVGSTIAWPLGIAAGLAAAHSSGLMAATGPAAWAQQHALVGAIAGLIAGILTGALMPRGRPALPARASAY